MSSAVPLAPFTVRACEETSVAAPEAVIAAASTALARPRAMSPPVACSVNEGVVTNPTAVCVMPPPVLVNTTLVVPPTAPCSASESPVMSSAAPLAPFTVIACVETSVAAPEAMMLAASTALARPRAISPPVACSDSEGVVTRPEAACVIPPAVLVSTTLVVPPTAPCNVSTVAVRSTAVPLAPFTASAFADTSVAAAEAVMLVASTALASPSAISPPVACSVSDGVVTRPAADCVIPPAVLVSATLVVPATAPVRFRLAPVSDSATALLAATSSALAEVKLAVWPMALIATLSTAFCRPRATVPAEVMPRSGVVSTPEAPAWVTALPPPVASRRMLVVPTRAPSARLGAVASTVAALPSRVRPAVETSVAAWPLAVRLALLTGLLRPSAISPPVAVAVSALVFSRPMPLWLMPPFVLARLMEVVPPSAPVMDRLRPVMASAAALLASTFRALAEVKLADRPLAVTATWSTALAWPSAMSPPVAVAVSDGVVMTALCWIPPAVAVSAMLVVPALAPVMFRLGATRVALAAESPVTLSAWLETKPTLCPAALMLTLSTTLLSPRLTAPCAVTPRLPVVTILLAVCITEPPALNEMAAVRAVVSVVVRLRLPVVDCSVMPSATDSAAASTTALPALNVRAPWPAVRVTEESTPMVSVAVSTTSPL